MNGDRSHASCAFFFFCLMLSTAIFLLPAVTAAQDNYPIPSGNPEDWTKPGRTYDIAPPQLSYGGSADPFVSRRHRENEARNDPNAPWSESREEYTGTNQFGSIAGTGITAFGTRTR
jgi:hypothetical protein